MIIIKHNGKKNYNKNIIIELTTTDKLIKKVNNYSLTVKDFIGN